MQAMRTGACTLVTAFVEASASGAAEAVTLPMASSNGRPSIAPAPLRNARRGMRQLRWRMTGAFSISFMALGVRFNSTCRLVVFGIEAVTKRVTHGNGLNEHG